MQNLEMFMQKLEQLPNGGDDLMRALISSAKVVRRETPGADMIIKAQNIINDPSLYNDKPYLITTRNQRYISDILPEDVDSACVILSSGDTIFELISRGVSKILALDINDLQTLIFKLRCASIKTLSAKEFEDFLINCNNSRFMSPDVFRTVKSGFDNDDLEAINFWEFLLNLNSKEDLFEYFFKGVGGNLSKTLYSLPYLKTRRMYYQLRDNLEKAEIDIEIQSAPDYLIDNPDAKFDYIDFMNILLFIYQLGCNDNAEEFSKKVMQLRGIYDNNLNGGGVFVLDHLFGINVEDLSAESVEGSNEYIRNIYKLTYALLSEQFDLNTLEVSKLIDGFGKRPNDTVVYTKKRKNRV